MNFLRNKSTFANFSAFFFIRSQTKEFISLRAQSVFLCNFFLFSLRFFFFLFTLCFSPTFSSLHQLKIKTKLCEFFTKQIDVCKFFCFLFYSFSNKRMYFFRGHKQFFVLIPVFFFFFFFKSIFVFLQPSPLVIN